MRLWDGVAARLWTSARFNNGMSNNTSAAQLLLAGRTPIPERCRGGRLQLIHIVDCALPARLLGVPPPLWRGIHSNATMQW